VLWGLIPVAATALGVAVAAAVARTEVVAVIGRDLRGIQKSRLGQNALRASVNVVWDILGPEIRLAQTIFHKTPRD